MADKTPDTAQDAQRMVLKRERALILPDDIDITALLDAVKTFKIKGSALNEVWLPIGEFPGASMRKAIEAHTGKPNQPDTKVGTFKAVSLTNWRGGVVMVAPAKPLVVAKPLED
jgi:hypothetical protein